MSARRGFQYALEPILQTRTWELDALLLDLGECNGELARLQQQRSELDERKRQAADEWMAASQQRKVLSLQSYELVTRFLADLGAQARLLDEAQVQCAQRRDGLIDQAVMAQRALEAFEQHRDDMKAQFIKLRMSGDFKIADDQWNTLQARIERHET